MPLLKTYRKITADGDGSLNQQFTVAMSVENGDDLYVYEGDNLSYEGVHYTVLSASIPNGIVGESTVVRWIGNSIDRTTYTFVRATPLLQPSKLETGLDEESVEIGINRLAMQCQEGIFATLESYDATGSRISCLGAPLSDEDAATYLYAQARYSKGGTVPPGITDSDENKLLYSESETTVGWRNPNTIPTPTANDKILRVGRDGVPAWETQPTVTPTQPLVPEYLSVNTDGSTVEWRAIADLPAIANAEDDMCVVCQEGGSVAWEEVADVATRPPLVTAWFSYPHADEVLYWNQTWVFQVWSKEVKSSGFGGGGGISPQVLQELAIGTCTKIDSRRPSNTHGTATTFDIRSSAISQERMLMEQDVGSCETDPDKITRVFLVLYKQSSNNNTNKKTAIVGRLKTAFVENEATWLIASTGVPWVLDGAVQDVDYEMHCMPMEIDGNTNSPPGFYEYDITHLYLDAIRNRSNILRMLLFIKDGGSPTVYNRFYSDDYATTPTARPKIRVESIDDTKRGAQWFQTDMKWRSILDPEEFGTTIAAIIQEETPDAPAGDHPGSSWGDFEPHWNFFQRTGVSHMIPTEDMMGGNRGIIQHNLPTAIYEGTPENEDNEHAHLFIRQYGTDDLSLGELTYNGVLFGERVRLYTARDIFHNAGLGIIPNPSNISGHSMWMFWSPIDVYTELEGEKDGEPCHE